MSSEDLLMIHICMSHNVDKELMEVVHDHVTMDHANHEVFQRKVNVHSKDSDGYVPHELMVMVTTIRP